MTRPLANLLNLLWWAMSMSYLYPFGRGAEVVAVAFVSLLSLLMAASINQPNKR